MLGAKSACFAGGEAVNAVAETLSLEGNPRTRINCCAACASVNTCGHSIGLGLKAATTQGAPLECRG